MVIRGIQYNMQNAAAPGVRGNVGVISFTPYFVLFHIFIVFSVCFLYPPTVFLNNTVVGAVLSIHDKLLLRAKSTWLKCK